MPLPQILEFARTLLTSSLHSGDTAIDATIGNGHDTLFLAKAVGANGTIFGFDIQATAIARSRERLEDENMLENVQLIQDSHAKIEDYCKNTIPKAAIFNLGYLPGSDKTITTTAKSTISAIQQLLKLMPKNGVIVLVVYHGHTEGKREKNELLSYVETLPQKLALVARYEFLNHDNDPPFIIAIEKKKEGDLT